MVHDCRFCICVSCFPWEEGVHNFRHPWNERACNCARCTHERPPYIESSFPSRAPAQGPFEAHPYERHPLQSGGYAGFSDGARGATPSRAPWTGWRTKG